MQPLSFLLPRWSRRPAVLGTLALLVFISTLLLFGGKNRPKSDVDENRQRMTVEELPPSKPANRYPTGKLSFKQEGSKEKQEPKWEKHHALNGRPTVRFRDNLKPDTKYVTTWNFGGMTNELMVWMNLIKLGVTSNRVPILFPVTGIEWQAGVGVESVSAGAFFDLPRLSKAIGLPVLDWQDVKRGRFNRPWHETDTIWHEDDEPMGCWSIVQTFDESKRPIDREGGPHFLHIDAHYTAVPESVRLKGVDSGWHTSFDTLSYLMSSKGRSAALTHDPPLLTFSKRPLPPTTPRPDPDDHVACFDSLYWVWSAEVWEWEREPSPTWETIGRHMHFNEEANELADIYLRKVFGVGEGEAIPPFISIHARHGDFKNLCRNKSDLSACFTPVAEYDRHIRELRIELEHIHGPDYPHTEVIMMSDETDPKWWAEVEREGWKHMRRVADEIARDYGKRWPAILDSLIQSRGAAFIGTSQSTMSLVAARRVKDWNKGPVRILEWTHL